MRPAYVLLHATCIGNTPLIAEDAMMPKVKADVRLQEQTLPAGFALLSKVRLSKQWHIGAKS